MNEYDCDFDEVQQKEKNITAEPPYHCGPLLVKYDSKGDFKPFFGELRGTTLFLNDLVNQESNLEKLNLEKVETKDLPCPYMTMGPTIFTLTLSSSVVQMQMDNPKEGEIWRGYLLTLTERRISRKLMLPHSVIKKLESALEQENTKSSAMGDPQLSPGPSQQTDEADYQQLNMPECFIDVTRNEAEKMLEVCPENGNLIIRPSKTSRENFAVTMRLLKPRGHRIQHFLVFSKDPGYVIDISPPKEVDSMDEVVEYFCEKTRQKAVPYGTVRRPVHSLTMNENTFL